GAGSGRSAGGPASSSPGEGPTSPPNPNPRLSRLEIATVVSPLSVTLHRHDPAVAVVTLLGEHDSQSAGRLESELALLLDERVNLVADLSEATFLDYHALSVLLSARYRAEEEQL